MRFFWIVGMVVSGLAVAVFSEPGLAALLTLLTLGLALVMAPLLMNLWMPLVLLVPVMVFHASGRTFLGIFVAAALALAAVLLDAFLITQGRARAIPEQGPELTALAVPPRSIEVVAHDWSELGARAGVARTICGPMCAALLTGGGIDWLRVRVEDRKGRGPAQSYVIQAAPVADCAARLPGYDQSAPCLLFRPDDGAAADLIVKVSVNGVRHFASSRVRPLHVRRTVITDTRPGGGVVHDRTDGSWDVARSPPILIPNASMHGGPWGIRRLSTRHVLTDDPPLDVLSRAGLAIAPLEGPEAAGDWRTAPWRAALMASAHDLRASGHNRDARLGAEVRGFVAEMFDRPLASFEALLRWQLATSSATSDVVRVRRTSNAGPDQIVPNVGLLLDAIESPDFGTGEALSIEIARQVLADPPGTHAALADRYFAAMRADPVHRRHLLPAVDRLGADPLLRPR